MRSARLVTPVVVVLLGSLAFGCKKPEAQTHADAAASASHAPIKVSPPPPPPAQPFPATGGVVAGSNDFACALWKKIPKGNAAVSPASISLALAMTYAGAKDDTATEIEKTLRFPGGPDVTTGEWGKVASALVDPARATKIKIANRLYGEKSITFEQPFLDATKEHFHAPLEPVDFKGDAEGARKQINGWVENQTEKKVKDLIPEGALTGATKLTLVNAIHFLGQWASPFDKAKTKPQAFSTGAKTKKDVPMMEQTSRFLIAVTPAESVLELPYKDDTAMLVVLPRGVEDLPRVEASLGPQKLAEWDRGLTNGTIHVTIPTFTIDPAESIKLGATLKEMGMPLAFDKEKASFDGIAPSPDPKDRLRIDQVFHKAFVKVDEAGTEAAAATAVAMARGGGAAPAKPLEFRADHPFLFLIIDKKTKLVLFVGRVIDP